MVQMAIFSSFLPYHVILKLEIGNLAQYIVFPWPNEEDRTWFFENPSTGSKVTAFSVYILGFSVGIKKLASAHISPCGGGIRKRSSFPVH